MLMFLFPIIYVILFYLALKKLLSHDIQGIFLFLLFGLSIYTISLSVTFLYGYSHIVPYMQSFKEIIIIVILGYSIYYFNKKIQLHTIDYLLLTFFFYAMLYTLLPLGTRSFFEKILAFKSIAFFSVTYFAGRFINFHKINITKQFYFICTISIAAAFVLLIEVFTYTHLQTLTGYADYNWYFFNNKPEGDYGLSWTFQIENGTKRFASFFANPLEHAAATLLTLAALGAIITDHKNNIRFSKFTLLTFACTLFSISFALSRASFVSYFFIIYIYSLLTKKKIISKIFHYSFLIGIIGLLFISIQKNFFLFIIETIQFSNASSIGHVIEWLNGLDAITTHPLGLGLGESGRVSSSLGSSTGGENQFIIIGVQLGIIALFIYILAYVEIIRTAYRSTQYDKGKIRKLALFVFLIKVGLIIPLFTSETESYIYISYVTWFLTGLLINMVVQKNTNRVYAIEKISYRN